MREEAVANERFDSWKEIADYLGWTERTLARWEKEKGLPIHRIPGGRRQAVFAFKEELDAWLTRDETGNSTAQAVVDGQWSDMATPSSLTATESEIATPDGIPNPVVPAKLGANSRLRRAGYWTLWLGAAILLLAIGYLYVDSKATLHEPQLRGQQQLTDNGLEKSGLLTDGKNLYFGQEQDGRYALAAMAAGGGPVRVLWSPPTNVLPVDISRDGKKLLALTRVGAESEEELWIVPLDTGEPHRLRNTMAHSAAWSPNGKEIAYAWGSAVFLTSEQEVSTREIGPFAAIPRELLWSKDGQRLHFILVDAATNVARSWGEISGNGMTISTIRPLPVLADSGEPITWVRAPEWDGYLVIGSLKRPGGTPVWLGQFGGTWWEPTFHTVSIGSFLGRVLGTAPLQTSSRLFVLSEPQDRAAFFSFDARTRGFRRILPGASGRFLDYSRDGKWVAYVADEDRRLDVSKADGSYIRPIASDPGTIELPRWSPDGKKIAYSAQRRDRPWRIYVFDFASGATQEASDSTDSQGAPTWSPDGRFLAYGNVSCQEANTCAIRRIDLATGKVETLPNSEGLFTARWSPDGRFIAALHVTQHQVFLFDVKTRKWERLADAVDGSDLSWSRDSKYLYANVHGSDGGIVRIRASNGNREKVRDLSLDDKADMAEMDDLQFSLGPDDSVILHRRIHSEEVYAYDLRSR